MKVDQAKLEFSLDVLSESQEIADLIAEVRWLERKLKIAKADEFLGAEGSSVAEREAKAIASESYKALSDQIRLQETKLEVAKARREMASIVVEVWRSQNASARASNIV